MTSYKALLVGENNVPRVGTVELPELESGQLLIKAVAFAANPTDWKHLAYGLASKDAIVGNDASGYIEAVGPNTKGFEKGDIVSTMIRGSVSKTQGAFGEYVIANAGSTLKYETSTFNTDEKLSIGENKSSLINSFEAAASITLSLATVGVSFAHHLKIDPEQSSGKYILIWGGSTATGIIAIQVAKKVYNLKVITTASPKNHEFLKSLGVDHILDYNSSNVVDQIKEIGGGEIHYALDTVSTELTFQSVYDATEGSKNARLDNLSQLNSSSIKTNTSRGEVPLGGTAVYQVDGKDMVFGDIVVPPSEELVRDFNHYWSKLVPPYLNEFKSANLIVLEPGLTSANKAFELLKENKISAGKVVFRLN